MSEKLKVGKSELLCKAQCGFYGNPAWGWYCSKCWRQHNAKHQSYVFDSGPVPGAGGAAAGSSGATASQFISPAKAQTLPSALNKSPLQSLIKKSPAGGRKSFSPLSPQHAKTLPAKDEKKRRMPEKIDKKSSIDLKQMFKKTTLGKDEVKANVRQKDDRPPQPPEAKAISKQFAEYLSSRVKKAGIADLSRNIQSFIDKVHRKVETLPIEEMSSMVQNFYQALARRLETHENFMGVGEEERAAICDMTERYVMVCCYKPLFCPFSTLDEEKDLEIQARIRSLNWVTTAHLECGFKETNPEVRDLIYTAINDILELDGSKAPQDKLASVVNCSKNIFSLLQTAKAGPASADDFFPSLVYILLKANPPRIFSNINFITRFANEQRLRSGEEGYYFTNLAAAMSFISRMKAQELNLPQAEFDSYMSGEAIPPGSWEASLLMCEGIQTMSQNLKALSDLRDLQEKLMSDAETLERDMAEFGESIELQVAAVLARTQYTIHGPRRPVTLDSSELPTPAHLPEPLVPTAAAADNAAAPGGAQLIPGLQPGTTPAPGGGGPEPMSEDSSQSLPEVSLSSSASSQDRVEDNCSLMDRTPCRNDLPSPLQPQLETSTPLLTSSSPPLSLSTPQPSSLASYVGFSAQSFSIPSISCNTAASDLLTGSPLESVTPLLQPSSGTSSSHPSPSSFPSSQPSPSSFTPSTTSPSSPLSSSQITERESPDSGT